MAPNSTLKSLTSLQLTIYILNSKHQQWAGRNFENLKGVVDHYNNIRECVFSDLLTCNL